MDLKRKNGDTHMSKILTMKNYFIFHFSSLLYFLFHLSFFVCEITSQIITGIQRKIDFNRNFNSQSDCQGNYNQFNGRLDIHSECSLLKVVCAYHLLLFLVLLGE